MIKKLLAFYIVAFSVLALPAQKTKILFIGNSYTYVNDLPQTLYNLALSKGDTLIFDSYTVGGYRFIDHLNDPACLAKINLQQWDYVVIQDQSQWPSWPPAQVATGVYPYAKRLDSLIHINNPCSETVFYMTWGRKNGDASNCQFFPAVCTFSGMNTRLRESYMQMAQDNHGTASPVGMAWKKLINTNASINLYQADESHPSIHGTYLTACVFYSTLFHKSSAGAAAISGINPAETTQLQNIASSTVLDSLDTWQQHGGIPNSIFTHTASGNQVQFTNLSSNATSYQWLFGDSGTSTQTNPSHTYNLPIVYTASLKASTACKSSASKDSVMILHINPVTGIDKTKEEPGLFITPNPASDFITVTHTAKNNSSIKIVNVLGGLVFYKENATAQERITIQQLAKGIYYLSIISDDKTLTKKIVKE